MSQVYFWLLLVGKLYLLLFLLINTIFLLGLLCILPEFLQVTKRRQSHIY